MLLEGTNVFSYIYHYVIFMVDDDKGPLYCFSGFLFIPKSVLTDLGLNISSQLHLKFKKTKIKMGALF